MKFAPVCPIHIYEQLEAFDPKALGDYFLLLAHDVLLSPDRYRKFFHNRPCTIIMDNSVIELGNACNAATLYEACEIVDASCVVMPDVQRDGEATLLATDKFLDEWAKLTRARDFQKLFLPQGFDADDFEHCVTLGLQRYSKEIDWIGIPRNLTGRVYKSRAEAVDFVLHHIPKEVKVHLFGFSDDTKDDLWTAKAYRLQLEGIDSAVPMRCLAPLQDPIQDAGPRGDWWDTCEFKIGMAMNILEVRKRIGEEI